MVPNFGRMNQAMLYSWYEQEDETEVQDPRVIATADVCWNERQCAITLHGITTYCIQNAKSNRP